MISIFQPCHLKYRLKTAQTDSVSQRISFRQFNSVTEVRLLPPFLFLYDYLSFSTSISLSLYFSLSLTHERTHAQTHIVTLFLPMSLISITSAWPLSDWQWKSLILPTWCRAFQPLVRLPFISTPLLLLVNTPNFPCLILKERKQERRREKKI